jgi:hypothetical protein
MGRAVETSMTNAEYIHPWQAAGLGLAPFRWIGVERKVGPIVTVGKDGLEWSVGAPGQPMGTCAYCGQGIAECHEIESADKKRFIVGCDCVARVHAKGDKVLTAVEKASRDLRNAAARARNKVKSDDSLAQVRALLADEVNRAKLSAKPSAYAWKAAQGLTALDDAEWMANQCGHSGRVRFLKRLRAELGI